MVISERQDGGTYALSGRKPNERLNVPKWPCGASTIRQLATKDVPKKWIDECVKVSNDLLTEQ